MRKKLLHMGLVALLAAACTDAPTAIPKASLVRLPMPLRSMSGADPFFTSWSWQNIERTSPIPTLPYTTNTTLPRVFWANIHTYDVAASWAHVHPGRLFIVGDEMDKDGDAGHYHSLDSAAAYARDYCLFITWVKDSDATARFTPAGISQLAPPAWYNNFYNGYQTGGCGPSGSQPTPIAEWTFHYFGSWSSVQSFKDSVDSRATWAINHGAPLSLGSWDLGPDGSTSDYVAALYDVKEWLAKNPNVVHTRYLSYEYDSTASHPLQGSDGNLSAEGQAMAAPAPFVQGPTSVKPNVTCTFSAGVAGNSPPYSHSWSVDGASGSPSGAYVDVTNFGYAFTIYLTTTDANGRSHSTSRVVTASSGAPGCLN